MHMEFNIPRSNNDSVKHGNYAGQKRSQIKKSAVHKPVPGKGGKGGKGGKSK